MSLEWKELKEEQKQPYIDEAEANKERYNQEKI